MKILHGQSLLDLAIQTAGSVEAAYDFAVANGLSVTDDLIVGKEHKATGVINKSVLNYYTQKNIKPATAITGIDEFTNRIFDYTFDLTFN